MEKIKSEKKNFDVRVHNLFLMKSLIDVENDNVALVGTFIQKVLRSDEIDIGEDIECEDTDSKGVFPYRFNEETANADVGFLQMRKKIERKDSISTTFAVKAPLRLSTVFSALPFKIIRASLDIELGSVTGKKDKKTFLPDLVIHEHAHNGNTCIRKYIYDVPYGGKDSRFIENHMDKSIVYDFVSPFPNVSYFHDKDKDQCAKINLEFFLVTGGFEKFVEIICPMILITVMNTIHVLKNTGGDDTMDFLANSATFALTAVFILPSIIQRSGKNDLWTVNNLYIMIVTLALSLSSFPSSIGSKWIGITGMALHYVSFLCPCYNLYKFQEWQRHVRGVKAQKEDDFYQGETKHNKDYTRVSKIEGKYSYEKCEHDNQKYLIVKTKKRRDNLGEAHVDGEFLIAPV